MDLENLKSIWKQITESELEKKKLNKQELEELLKGKTHNAVTKINRSIILEVGILLLASFGFSIHTFFYTSSSSQQKVFFGIIILICIMAGVYYWIKYREINKIAISSQNLKNSLKKLISITETFLKIYFYGGIILTPVSFITGFYYGILTYGDISLQETLQLPYLIIIIISTVILTVFMYPFTKCYIRKGKLKKNA